VFKEGGGILDIGRSRQSAINAFLTNCEVSEYLRASTTSLRDRQRLVSSSANKASAWLTSIPSSPELGMNDADFIFAIRHRLGLPCAEGLPEKCPCDVMLASDLSHFHSCKSEAYFYYGSPRFRGESIG